MKKNVLQMTDGRLQAVTVDMTPEEEAALCASTPEVAEEPSRLDEIEAALMELATIVGGAE